MAVTVFFSFFMCINIYFFGLAGTMDSPFAWIYAAFMLILYVRMMITKNWSRYRSLFQIVLAVLFMISFIGILYDERGSMSITETQFQNAETPFCQIVIPIMLIPLALTKTVIFPARMTGHFASVVSMLLIWFIVSVTIGRGWCSWVCFYGGWEEGFSRVPRKPKIKLLSRNRDIRAFQFAFLFFIVLVSLASLSSVYCEWFCPFKLVTEYPQITDITSLIATVMFIGLFLGLVIVMPLLTKKRFQCSTLCPFGAFQSVVDKVTNIGIRIDSEKCTGCMQCASVCRFFAIDTETIKEKKGQPEITCAKCGECISVCPQKAIDFAYKSSPAGKILGTIFRTDSRIVGAAPEAQKGCQSRTPKSAAGRFVAEILEPRYLFVFMAFTFSLMISNKFVPDALSRIWQAIAGGLR